MSVFESARFIRLATVLAVALVLLLSGVVVGAAGGPLIMGAANGAGTTNTSLTTSSTGNALLVTQTSTGTAVRGVATNGIAGFFQSANGSGVSGVVAANTKFGVFGANDAAAFGGGAAIRASGQQNHGVVATTANAAADALRGINTGGGQGLDLVVNAGVAPMSVNSNTKVVNLHADLFDGLDYDDILQGNVLRISHSAPQVGTNSSVTWFTVQFTQPAGHVASEFAAEATITVPPTCGDTQLAYILVTLDAIPGWTLLQGQPSWSAGTANLPVRVVLRNPNGFALVAPSSDTTRTVTVSIGDDCTSGSHFTFTNFTLDVVFAK